MNSQNQPLNGMRILDLCEGTGDLTGRYLADLGAEVILVEPSEGSKARQRPPMIDGASAFFATHNANKKSLVLNAESKEDKAVFRRLAATSDLVIHERTECWQSWSETLEAVKTAENPALVTLAISDFGDSGPYSGYVATNSVQMAMTGVLARSGIKGRDPLLPPGNLAYESAAIQAAWVGLLAHWQRLQTGSGGHLDFSIFEATCQILDPALGVTGSAAGGKSATALAPRGRPPVGMLYPFFPCADGYVRLCVLSPRQWAAMSDWLGNDHPFTDPSFGHVGKRFKHMSEIALLIKALFATQAGHDLVLEGQRRGVPIAAVATPQEVFCNKHFSARAAFTDLQWPNGQTGKAPSGYVKINGQRMGIRTAAPGLNAHFTGFDAVAAPITETLAAANKQSTAIPSAASPRKPLAGIRMLDLGVIVAGAELGRLFADQGADVIKIESKSYPDGLRQSIDQADMTLSFAQGSRGKKSLGLNLRSEEGKRLFKALVKKSDVVVSNFKPGTMDSLGFGYDVLKAINPRIIVSESSALGGSGPMSKTMGYGPLVRASSGLTGLWRYPDDDSGFADATTIFPDHLAARVSAAAILALLIERHKTGIGGTVSLSQAETIMMSLSSEFVAESLLGGSLKAHGNQGQFDAPANLFPCLGDDEWCVIEVRDTEEWLRLCEVMDRADLGGNSDYQSASGRIEHREYIEAEVASWTRSVTPHEATALLQNAGVPAGFMRRINELPEDEHLNERGFFRISQQPGLKAPLLTENAPVGNSHLPDPEINPAPFVAQHTREIMKSVLELDDREIDALVASGNLELCSVDTSEL
jgi:crotonobetainyl-CoA:carnitine CoA-transferase CaiB-like acyl-CoA transferase